MEPEGGAGESDREAPQREGPKGGRAHGVATTPLHLRHGPSRHTARRRAAVRNTKVLCSVSTNSVAARGAATRRTGLAERARLRIFFFCD